MGPFQERRISYIGQGRYELALDSQGPTYFSFWINGINAAVPQLRDFFAVLKNRYRMISNYNFDD